MLRKLFIASAVAILGSIPSFGQVAIGVQGSLQFSNFNASANGISISGNNVVGFQAGLMLDAPLSGNLSLRPQLLFSTKGSELSSGGATSKTTLNYLEVPIQLYYGLEAGNGKVVLGAGPYLAYGLGGTSTSTSGSQSQTESVKFGGNDNPQAFDYGLRLSAGYELNTGLTLSGYFSPGLANYAPSNAGNVSIKNTAFDISVGYFFSGRE